MIDNLLKRKKQVKKLLAEKLSFNYKNPLLAIILEKDLSKEDTGIMSGMLEGASYLNLHVIVLSDKKLPFCEFANVTRIPYSRTNRKYVIEASDIAMCFAFNDVEEMLLNGTIPISCSRNELTDYNPNHETGNSFLFTESNYFCAFAALVRAVETFKFPYDWSGIVRQGRDSVDCKCNLSACS